MAEFKLNKTIYDKAQYKNTIDTTFSNNQSSTLPVEETISINEFFRSYENLFYNIPIDGDTNSHTYLVQQSSQYIGSTSTPEEIQVLLDEITSLRQDLLVANQTILQMQISGSN
jgi:hypothetical protein